MENDTDFVKFWNNVLEPKFTKFKHIIQGGLSRHSKAILPDLPIKKGMSVLDLGCGWGNMSIEIAKLVGPSGHVVGISCVDAFLEVGRKETKEKDMRDYFNLEEQDGDGIWMQTSSWVVTSNI